MWTTTGTWESWGRLSTGWKRGVGLGYRRSGEVTAATISHPSPSNKVAGEGLLDSALLGQLFCMVSAEATPSSSHATVGQRELVKQGLQ